MESMGKRIRLALKDAGISQKRMAKILGVSEHTMTSIVRNRHETSVGNIRHIAQETGADLYWLITGEDFHPSAPTVQHTGTGTVISMSGNNERLNVKMDGSIQIEDRREQLPANPTEAMEKLAVLPADKQRVIIDLINLNYEESK